MEITINLYVLLWWAGLAILFAISNSIFYQRGVNQGYNDGFAEGVHAEIRKTGVNSYSVTIEREE